MKSFWKDKENIKKLQQVYDDPYSVTHLKATTVYKKVFGLMITKEAITQAVRYTGVRATHINGK